MDATTAIGKPPLAHPVPSARARARAKARLKEEVKARKARERALGDTQQAATFSVEARHYDSAFKNVHPSVSAEDRLQYELMRVQLRASRGHLDADAVEGSRSRSNSMADS